MYGKRVKGMIGVMLAGVMALSGGCGSENSTVDAASEAAKNAQTQSASAETRASFSGTAETETSGTNDPTKIVMLSDGDVTQQRFSAVSGLTTETSSETENVSFTSDTAVSGQKAYTIMVYMIGSSLEYNDEQGKIGFASMDLNEMIGADVDYSQVNVIVNTGGAGGWVANIPSDRDCILDLSKCSSIADIRSAIVATADDSPDMGTPETMAAFLDYCYEYYPAENYGLIFWDHGGGPLYGFGMDENNGGDGLSLEEMRRGMEQTSFAKNETLSFVGFDACLMASLETANVWKDYADYLVASEETEPGYGWDYSGLKEFSENTDELETLKSIVNSSGESMASTGSETTLSLMDLSKTEEVVSALDDLMDKMRTGIEGGDNASVQLLRNRSREFGASASGYGYDLVDLGDFADELSALYQDQAKDVVNLVDELVAAQYTNINGANGVSLYYPSSQLPVYEEYIEDAYRDVSPSDKYTSYLSDYYSVWESGDAASEDSESISAGSSTEDTIAFQMTESEAANFVSGYYNIYTGGFGNTQNYMPLKLHCAVEPDKNGTIYVPANPQLICLSTDEQEDPVPWMVRETDENAESEVYETINTFLSAGPEFSDGPLDESLGVKATVTVEKNGEIRASDFSSTQSSGQTAGKNTVDMNAWEGIFQISQNYTPKENADGATLPISEWDAAGYVEDDLSLNEQYTFSSVNGADLPQALYCQVVIRTADGGIGTSGVVELEEKNEVDQVVQETDRGSLTFDLYSDHAKLVSYSGSDTELDLPETVNNLAVTEIGERVFYGSSNLISVSIPEGVTKICNGAFYSCDALENVSLPSTLRSVGMETFANCEALSSVSLPEGLESIGKGAFSHCKALEEIELPSTLQTISTAVFSECTSLSSIVLNGENAACKMEQNVLVSADGKTLLAVPIGGCTFVKIPEGVETVSYGAFAGCVDLKMVEFPSSLKKIGNYAFYECSGLLNLTLPEHLNYIGERAFGKSRSGFETQAMAAIDEVVIGSEVSYIGGNAFNMIAASNITVNTSPYYASNSGFLTNVSGDYLLQAPQGISEIIHVPDGIVGIARDAFSRNTDITDIYIPASVTSIPENAFYHTYDDGNNEVYSIVIHGVRGSAAESYANEHNISFTADM